MQEISPMKLNLSVFSLIRTKKDCFYLPVNADYTPLKRYLFCNDSSNQTVQQILPKFNRDHKFFTAAFINPYQQSRLKQTSDETIERERQHFMRKVSACENSVDEDMPYFSPRDNNYCSLCQIPFQSYWHHTHSRVHTKRIKSNPFNSYIFDLCKRVKDRERQQINPDAQISRGVGKKKKIQKTPKHKKGDKFTQIFTREDFIVKLPSDLFQKQVQNIIYNASTNVLNTQDNPLKQ